MDKLQLMKVFVSVAEHGSFSVAAKQLNMSPPAATRAIAKLEQELGLSLFERSTRQVKLNESAQNYLEDCRSLLIQLEQAEQQLQGQHREVAGKLRISAPSLFGSRHLVPLLVGFLEAHPKVEIDSVLTDRQVDLVSEGVDVGIRISPYVDNNLCARELGVLKYKICASPQYLARYGAPHKPQDLAQHRLIACKLSYNRSMQWPFRVTGGEYVHQFQPKLAVNTVAAAIEASLQHYGLCRTLSYQVVPYLAYGQLISVLGEYIADQKPVHLIHQPNPSACARAFIDYLSPRLRSLLHSLAAQ